MTFRRISVIGKVFEKRNSAVVMVENKPILIVKYNNSLYGMDAICSHMGCGLLTDVTDNIATCPLHGAKFNVLNGEMIAPPQIKPEVPCEFKTDSKTPLKTYKVRINNEGFVEIDF
ncbi:Rieske (2Fe-2S) protein [Caldisphaera sp.]|uniref:Rieske (2Fe-2S) protein n=1 Tax=Caldisphaera sp. TaxID=2060322 RepID=UPI0025BB86E0|nr:Rieske (2Fe-2S) protein [Caldisphaera sp.]